MEKEPQFNPSEKELREKLERPTGAPEVEVRETAEGRAALAQALTEEPKKEESRRPETQSPWKRRLLIAAGVGAMLLSGVKISQYFRGGSGEKPQVTGEQIADTVRNEIERQEEFEKQNAETTKKQTEFAQKTKAEKPPDSKEKKEIVKFKNLDDAARATIYKVEGMGHFLARRESDENIDKDTLKIIDEYNSFCFDVLYYANSILKNSKSSETDISQAEDLITVFERNLLVLAPRWPNSQKKTERFTLGSLMEIESGMPRFRHPTPDHHWEMAPTIIRQAVAKGDKKGFEKNTCFVLSPGALKTFAEQLLTCLRGY